MSSSTGIVESRDKSFVLDLKLLFTHVLGVMHHWLVLHWIHAKGWRLYIEELRDFEAIEDFFCKFIYGDCRV